VVDQLVGWEGEKKEPTLSDIEEMVLVLRQELGRKMAEIMVRDQEEARVESEPLCPKCGKKLRYKGTKGEVVESLVGALSLEREYYYCAECAEGTFPPGSATGVGGQALE